MAWLCDDTETKYPNSTSFAKAVVTAPIFIFSRM